MMCIIMYNLIKSHGNLNLLGQLDGQIDGH